MKEYISGKQFCEMLMCASDALEANKQIVNELNVFPVPDGDTGTNMSLTLGSAAAEFRKKKYEKIGDAADKAASALLRGARGNSGVILSLLFRGISKALKGQECAYAEQFAAAMCDGVDVAYKAVMKPAEGTILTVSRAATKAALEMAKEQSDVELTLEAAIASAKQALALTVEQNPVLKRAGVIDAGGKGYVIILEAMLGYLRGTVTVNDTAPVVSEVRERADFAVFDTAEIEFAYDTVFIVSRTDNDKPLDLLRAYLDSIGDSLVISEGDDMFKVHVHTNIPGAALTEAAKYGTLETAKIENMRTQHDELIEGDDDDDRDYRAATAPEATEPEIAEPEKRYGFVAVCAGKGMAELFRELGVDGIVTGGQTMNPSTEDILREINRTPASTVFVFPNNKNIIMAAEQCVPLTEKKVIVVPTRTVPQGISAMLNMDTYADEDVVVETFRKVISNVHTAQITYAARDSEFDGHSIRAGEFLGLLDGALVGSYTGSDEMFAALCGELEKFEPEFISLYYGADVSEPEAENAAAILARSFPGAEISTINGGQPVYYYMISAE
ncbi:MAG: DAK2 domain-containing protein [Butyricicoccus sp.]|nr:DAK2 domain-containing protein [Butyricicoccus sp.]